MTGSDDFEARYASWRAACERTGGVSSSAEPYVDNDPFRAIVALGRPAIPAILDKLESDPEAHFLVHALAQITGQGFDPDEMAAAQRRYGEPLGNQGLALMWRDRLAEDG